MPWRPWRKAWPGCGRGHGACSRRPAAAPCRSSGAAQAFTFVMRGITRPPELPDNVIWVTGRPPFPVEAEVALFRKHEVAALLIQASGGELTYAKIEAARALAAAGRHADPASAAGRRLGLRTGGAGLARRRPRPQDVRVIGGVEPAVGEARLAQHPADHDQRRARDAGRLHRPRMSASVPRMIRWSGQVAR